MKIYISGPMTGIEDYNYPAFNEAAGRLRNQGHTVFNPAEEDAEIIKRLGKFDLREALAIDTSWIATNAEAIAMLPGWEYSQGAMAEWSLAKALKLKFMYL